MYTDIVRSVFISLRLFANEMFTLIMVGAEHYFVQRNKQRRMSIIRKFKEGSKFLHEQNTFNSTMIPLNIGMITVRFPRNGHDSS